MNNGSNVIRAPDEVAQRRDGPAPVTGIVRPQIAFSPALTRADSEPFSMEKVGHFFNNIVAPQGNALVSEMVDENGPLAGREAARGRRKSSALPMQFQDADRSTLFAPNDAPDELPERQSELDRLLQHQESRERRRFGA